MKWVLVYKTLLVAGIGGIVGSVFLSSLTWFVLIALLGACCIVLALVELRSVRKEGKSVMKEAGKSAYAGVSHLSYVEQPQEPVASVRRLPAEERNAKKSMLSRLAWLPKKEEKAGVDVKGIKGEETVVPKNELKKEEIQVIESGMPDGAMVKEKEVLLGKFVKDALKKGFSHQKVVEAGLQARWPQEVVEKAVVDVGRKMKKQRLVVFSILFLCVLMGMAVLSVLDMFLLPYWMKSLEFASVQFYIGAVLVVFSMIGFFVFKIKSVLKTKIVEEKVVEEAHVREIKSTLDSFGGMYGTDLDKLYALLEKKKKVKVNEVAKAFGVSKNEAEEWGKILKEQNLAELYYPTVGDLEIQWKSSKNTPSE